MKKNLFLLVLAMLMAVPMSMNAAKQNLGWLHFGEGATSYYDDASTPINITVNGTSYKAWQVLGMSGVYYVPNNSKGTKKDNLKIVYLKNANLTKNFRCTKSTTNLWVVVSGNCSVNYTKGSCFKMETGHLSVFGETGPEKDKLTVTTSGKYHCAYTDNGQMTFRNLTLNVKAAGDYATLSVEKGNYKMTFYNCNVTSNNPIYSKGEITLTDCSYSDTSMAWSSSNYYISKSGKKAYNINLKAKSTTTGGASSSSSSSSSSNNSSSSSANSSSSSANTIQAFDESKGGTTVTLPFDWQICGKNSFKSPSTKQLTINGKTYTGAKVPLVDSGTNTDRPVQDGAVYWVNSLKALYFEGTTDKTRFKTQKNMPFISMPRTNSPTSVELTVYIGSYVEFCGLNAPFISVKNGSLTIASATSNHKRLDYYNLTSLVDMGGVTLTVKNLFMNLYSGGSRESSKSSNPLFKGNGYSHLVLDRFSSNCNTCMDGVINDFKSIKTYNCGLSPEIYPDVTYDLTKKRFLRNGYVETMLSFSNSGDYTLIDTDKATNNVWKMADNKSESVTLPTGITIGGKSKFTAKNSITISSGDYKGAKALALYFEDGSNVATSGNIYWVPSASAFYIPHGTKTFSNSIKSTGSAAVKVYIDGTITIGTDGTITIGTALVEATGSGKVTVKGSQLAYVDGNLLVSVTGSSAVEISNIKMTKGHVAYANEKGSTLKLTRVLSKNFPGGFAEIITTSCGLPYSYKDSSTLVYNKTKMQLEENGTGMNFKAVGITTDGYLEVDTRYGTKSQNGNVVWPANASKRKVAPGPQVAQ